MVDVDRLISFGKSLSELVDFVAPQQAVQPAVRTLRLELGKAPSRSAARRRRGARKRFERAAPAGRKRGAAAAAGLLGEQFQSVPFPAQAYGHIGLRMKCKCKFYENKFELSNS